MTAPLSFQIATEEQYGDAPFFVFCDHASNHTPQELQCLGLPGDLLETHIAWDIGAGALTDLVGEKLSARVLKCGLSRLVVDVNRDPNVADVIPECSDQIPVPGNQNLTAADRAARIEDFHEPYHRRLNAAISEAAANADNLFAVSIHSFTNRLMGSREERPWEIGILWSADETSARAMINWLRRETDWTIGNNEPYDAREFNYSVDRHIEPAGLRHLTLEIRQDMLGDKENAALIADRLAAGIGYVREFG